MGVCHVGETGCVMWAQHVAYLEEREVADVGGAVRGRAAHLPVDGDASLGTPVAHPGMQGVMKVAPPTNRLEWGWGWGGLGGYFELCFRIPLAHVPCGVSLSTVSHEYNGN